MYPKVGPIHFLIMYSVFQNLRDLCINIGVPGSWKHIYLNLQLLASRLFDIN
jgi:hypothetical protein